MDIDYREQIICLKLTLASVSFGASVPSWKGVNEANHFYQLTACIVGFNYITAVGQEEDATVFELKYSFKLSVCENQEGERGKYRREKKFNLSHHYYKLVKVYLYS